MRAREPLKLKTLIDLEPSASKTRNSPKIEALFQSGHKKTKSESSETFTPKHYIAGLFSNIHSAAKTPAARTDRPVVGISTALQSRTHTRQNSQRDNKENISFVKPRASFAPNLREAKIFKLKERFEKALKKKHSFKKNTPISEQDISAVLSEMGIMSAGNKFFKQFQDSVLEMLKVGCAQPLAVNFFLIILAFQNIHLSKKELDSIVLGSYDRDKSKVLELDKLQVNRIAETYEQVLGKASKAQGRPRQCIQINVTLPDNRKELMVFRESEDYEQIAKKIMNKYAIPIQKLRNIESIIQSKLKEQS